MEPTAVNANRFALLDGDRTPLDEADYALAFAVHGNVERCADLTHTAIAESSEALYEHRDGDALD